MERERSDRWMFIDWHGNPTLADVGVPFEKEGMWWVVNEFGDLKIHRNPPPQTASLPSAASSPDQPPDPRS